MTSVQPGNPYPKDSWSYASAGNLSVAERLNLLPKIEPQPFDHAAGYHELKIRFPLDSTSTVVGLDWGCVDAPNLTDLPKNLREMWIEGQWRETWTDRDTNRIEKLCRWEYENKLSKFGREELTELREKLERTRKAETELESQRFAEKLAPRSPQSPELSPGRALIPGKFGVCD